MVTRRSKLTAVLVVVIVASSGIAGTVLGQTAPSSMRKSAEVQQPPSAQEGELNADTSCAANPPSDLSDPESDVKGWENGIWYNESIDVNQDDGVEKGEREKIVTRTMARLEAVRCIEFDQTVPVSVTSRQEYREQQQSRETSEGLRAFDNAKFEALFLVNESTDSIAVQNRNRGSGVLGFYSPQRDEIVVISESTETLRLDELTLAHELMHAWQDEEFNLSGDPFDSRLRDQANAKNGIVEGDASYTEDLYAQKCAGGWECLEARRGGASGQLANLGVYLLKFQPYSDGPAFVRMARQIGGWDAVNSLYENPPASTEQVIHPQRYAADEPTNVTLNDTANESWSRVTAPNRPDYAEVGEAALMAMFIYPYYHSGGQTNVIAPGQWFNRNETGNISDFDPLNYESKYSVGWDGDRLHAYRNEAGEFGYVWKLTWDSPQDAQQFVEGYRKLLRYWGGQQVGPSTWRIADGGFEDAFYIDVEGTNVTIVNAPTTDQLTGVREGIQPIVNDPTTTRDDETAEGATTEADEANETTTAS